MCANIFIQKDDKYLVLRRSPLKRWAAGVVHPVGGKIDLNEDPLTAAKREALEETGVAVKNLKLEAVILEVEPVKAEPGNWIIFHFSGEYDSGEVLNTEEGELVWLTADEIKQEKLFPSVRAIVDKIFDPNSGTIFARFEYKSDHELDSGAMTIEAMSR